MSASVILWSCFLIIVFAFVVVSRQQQTLKAKRLDGGISEGQKIVQEVQEANAKTKRIKNIYENNMLPQEIINSITKLVSGGITPNNYEINYETATVNLMGVSESKDRLLEFKNKLSENERFEEVNLPLSSFTEENNFEFSIGFMVRALIKKETPKLKLDI